MPQLETAVKKSIRLRLGRRPNLLLKNNPQHGFGMAGVCDMDGCWEGDYLGIEVKTQEAYSSSTLGLSEPQVEYGLRVLRCGGLWMVTYSAQHAWDTLESIRSQEYANTWIDKLESIKSAKQAEWSAKRQKHTADGKKRRQRLRPIVQQRLVEEAAQAESDRLIEERYRRRMKRGKTPIPWEVLRYGLHRKTEEA